MKKDTSKRKKTIPVKPKPTWIKIELTEQSEIEKLEEIKRITKMTVTSKAVWEALLNYPKVLKRADGLNDELMKVNREHEQVINKFETVQRAFSIVMEVTPSKKFDTNVMFEHDENECITCGEELENGECPNECEQ
jgi:hypothetical protein